MRNFPAGHQVEKITRTSVWIALNPRLSRAAILND